MIFESILLLNKFDSYQKIIKHFVDSNIQVLFAYGVAYYKLLVLIDIIDINGPHILTYSIPFDNSFSIRHPSALVVIFNRNFNKLLSNQFMNNVYHLELVARRE